MSNGTVLVWHRRDLRIDDLPSVRTAVHAGDSIVPIFVIDDRLLASSPNRAWFLVESLRALAEDWARRGSPLIVRAGRPESEIARVAQEIGAHAVHATRGYSPRSIGQERAVERALVSIGVHLQLFEGAFLVEPPELGRERPFRSFRAFKQRWDNAGPGPALPPPELPRVTGLPHSSLPESVGIPVMRPTAEELPLPGAEAARTRLRQWSTTGLDSYGERRDLLSEPTSGLSQDLRFGLLSPGDLLRAGSNRSHAFLAELAWRDYAAHSLWCSPHMVREPFDRRFLRFPWRDDETSLEAWARGETGVPVVDAAMRQLQHTGFIHNRARMIAASFLVKDLLIDWRHGARVFMRHLVDGDPASNTFNWQWVAGCGPIAMPFFRMFNPVVQGMRFDPAGAYVRRWLPELRGVPGEYIHRPWEMPATTQAASGCHIGRHYPRPIVDHARARNRALEAFRSLPRSGAIAG